MIVFVANPTLQHREFHYRLPNVQTARMLAIPACGQAQFPEDLSGPNLASVLKQLEHIGAVPKSDLNAILRPKALLFDVAAKPITADAITEGLERDESARQEVAAAKMEESGLAAFQRAEIPGAKLVEASMEIVEVTDRGKAKDGVNFETVVSSKPQRRASRKRTETKA